MRRAVVLPVMILLLVGTAVLRAGNGAPVVLRHAVGSVSFDKAITVRSPVLYPYSMAAGDLTGNGIPDLAVVGIEQAFLYHALGKGNGRFGWWNNRGAAGDAPGFVTFADVDLDGNLDAVSTSADQPLVNIAFGDGRGHFPVGEGLASGRGYDTQQVVVADLNGDGIPDLVGTSLGESGTPGNIFILLGKGHRKFAKAVNIGSGGYAPAAIAVADLNHDGIPDLVVANWGQDDGPYGNLAVLLGKGNGTFAEPVVYLAGIHPYQLVLGDFNGDGNLDVAVTNNLDVRVFMGRGDGTLSKGAGYFAGRFPISIATADFNGDGIPDLVVSNFTNPKPCHASVLLGNGDGTFQAPTQFRVRLSPVQVVVADFNHDGKPDIATINQGNATISILLNTTQFRAQLPSH
jgi:hypothetical protein